MSKLRPMLTGCAFALMSSMACAQGTSAPDTAQMQPQMQPQMPAETGGNATPAPTRITTRTADPLVRKRINDTAANQQYKADKQASKRHYKSKVKQARVQRKEAHHAATAQEKAQLSSQPAKPSQPGAGTNQQ